MSITPITNGESGSNVRTSLNSVIDVINGGTAASDVIGVPLTTGVTGTLPVANGGMGATTHTAHGVLLGAAGSAIAATAAGTAGQPLQSGGASADPAFAALNLATAASITGVLPLANGGMGAVLTGSKTYDPASMLTLGQVSTTVTVTGAALGDYVLLSHSASLALVSLTGYVSATDTVTAVYFNGSSGTVDVASGTLTARVIKTA